MRLRNGTVATAIIFFTSFLSLSWYTAWQNGKGRLAAVFSRICNVTRLRFGLLGRWGASRRGLVARLVGTELALVPRLVAGQQVAAVRSGCIMFLSLFLLVFIYLFFPPDMQPTICHRLHSIFVRPRLPERGSPADAHLSTVLTA